MRAVASIVLIIGVVTMLSGCARVRLYTQDRERVDQELPPGAEAYYPDRSKTRKVFVLEVSQKPKEYSTTEVTKETAIEEVADDGATKVVTQERDTTVIHERNFTFPRRTPEELTTKEEVPAVTVQEYVVQKDDTLQKISKKFYDSYSKWPRIYDANRDVIKDPNFVKPGTKLVVPME